MDLDLFMSGFSDFENHFVNFKLQDHELQLNPYLNLTLYICNFWFKLKVNSFPLVI